MSPSELQHLLDQYIAETISAPDFKRLWDTLTQDEYASQWHELTENMWNGQKLHQLGQPNQKAVILANLRQLVLEDEKRIPPVSVRGIKNAWFRYAAAILLLVSTGTYIWLQNRKETPLTNIVPPPLKTDLAPGHQGAILTLSDGTNVILDSLANGVIAHQNGMQVLLNNGQLTYNHTGKPVDAITWNTMTTPKGRQFQVVLPDGTKVWLNAGSSLKYPTAFADKERQVEVKGEAYFEIAKNALLPFKVMLNDKTEIEVLGTTFNVNNYQNEKSIHTTLLEGVIKLNADGKNYPMTPGQQARLTDNGRVSILNNVNINKQVAWKSGIFDFQDAGLEDVMKQIERWYNVQVVYQGKIPDVEFGGKIRMDLPLSGVLRFLEVMEVKCRLEEGNRLVVLSEL